jgi:hypothetical protein
MVKKKLLFVNTPKAVCSIHESGLMVYNCIIGSKEVSIDYIEIDEHHLVLPSNYDIYLFNYHIVTTGWLDTASVNALPGLKGTIILEILPNDPFIYCSPFDFDFYCVLDPSMTFKHKKVFVFPRPLESYNGSLQKEEHQIPIIGSFGFATKGKGFEHVVRAVNKEFDKAVVRINIPHGSYTDPSHAFAHELAQMCKELANPGIEVIITHDFMDKAALIQWCNRNTLNCFLYDRNMPGLAATTDQAIVSEQPLSISENNTFRHITKYIKPYPHLSLREAIATTKPIVKQIKQDWSQHNFLKHFEAMLKQFPDTHNAIETDKGFVALKRLRRNSLRYKLKKQLNKFIRVYYKSSLYAIFH